MATETQVMAQRLAQIEGERAALVEALKQAAAEQPFLIEGGAVGWRKTQKQEAKATAAHLLFTDWQSKGGDLNGFLVALKPGMASLQAVASKLHKDKTDRERCIAEWSQVKNGREFGPYRSE